MTAREERKKKSENALKQEQGQEGAGKEEDLGKKGKEPKPKKSRWD